MTPAEVITAFRIEIARADTLGEVEATQDRAWRQLGRHDAVENTVVGQEGSARREALKMRRQRTD